MEDSDREWLRDELRKVVEGEFDRREFLCGIVRGGASEELTQAYDRLSLSLLNCRWHRESLERECQPGPEQQRLSALAADATVVLEHAVQVLLRVLLEQMRDSRAEADERHQELLSEIRQLRADMQA